MFSSHLSNLYKTVNYFERNGHMDGNNNNTVETEFTALSRLVFFSASVILTLLGVKLGGAFEILSLILASSLMLISSLAAKNILTSVLSFFPGIISYIIYALFVADTSGGYISVFLAAFPALFSVIPTLGIWMALKLKMSRSHAIAFTSVLCVCFLTFILALRIKVYMGVLDVSTVRAVIDAFFEPIEEMLSSLTYDHGSTNIQFYSDSDIANIINTAKRTLIGTVGAAMLIFVYLVTFASRLILSVFGLSRLFPTDEIHVIAFRPSEKNDMDICIERIRTHWRIDMSTVGATFAVIAYFTELLFSDPEKNYLIVTVAENILILLLPGLVYVGFRAFMATVTGISRGFFGILPPNGKRKSGRPILFILGIVLFVFSPTVVFLCLAANGVIDIFSESFRKKGAYNVMKNNIGNRKE